MKEKPYYYSCAVIRWWSSSYAQQEWVSFCQICRNPPVLCWFFQDATKHISSKPSTTMKRVHIGTFAFRNFRSIRWSRENISTDHHLRIACLSVVEKDLFLSSCGFPLSVNHHPINEATYEFFDISVATLTPVSPRAQSCLLNGIALCTDENLFGEIINIHPLVRALM